MEDVANPTEEPTYTELAAQNSDSGNTTPNLDDTQQVTETVSKDDYEKLQKQFQEAQSFIGKQGNDIGDMRQQIAKLEGRTEALTQPTQETPKSLAEAVANDPQFANISIPPEQLKVLSTLIEAGVSQRLEAQGFDPNQMQQQVEQMQAMQASQQKNEMMGQIEGVKKKFGEEVLTKHNAAIVDAMNRDPNLKLEQAVWQAAGQEAAAAMAAQSETSTRQKMAAEANISPGNGSPRPLQAPKVNYQGMARGDILKAMMKEDGVVS